MNTRQELEKLELKTLATYAAKSKLTKGRKYAEKDHPYRTDYQRDRDRIIHSRAFRRLQAKTQVYIEHEGDYFRTRLTHSMETAQISRTIARVLKLNEDLTETLALAHDLGHPPFGHAGEEALTECMKDHGRFEHNWQGVRIVEQLETKYDSFDGLNLTWEVRESMRKHTIKKDFPIEREFNPTESPLLECQLVDLTDYIAYNSHDVDDAIKAGIITPKNIESLGIWSELQKFSKEKHFSRTSIRFLIDYMVSDLIKTTQLNLKKYSIKSIDDVRRTKEKIVSFSKTTDESIRELYKFLMSNVYKHYKVERMANKGKRFIKQLFQAFIDNPKQLPTQYQGVITKQGLERTTCDYIAGMTDKFAQEEVKKLFYPFEHLL